MELILHIWLYYGTISVWLMLFFIILLGIHSKFKTSSFYRIVQCDMILNLICYFNSFIFRLASRPDTGYLFENVHSSLHWFFKLVAFCTHFFYQTQSASVIILCAYRYSLLHFEDANKFWAKWYFVVYLGVCLYSMGVTVPFSYVFHPMIYDEDLKYFNNWGQATEEELFAFKCQLLITTLFYFTSIVTLGILTLKNLRLRFTNHQDDQRTKKMMKRMTIIVAINSIVYVIVILWEFIMGVFFRNITDNEKTNMMMCVTDMLSFSMPYTLLICDKNVQEVIFGQLHRLKLQISSNSSSVAPRA